MKPNYSSSLNLKISPSNIIFLTLTLIQDGVDIWKIDIHHTNLYWKWIMDVCFFWGQLHWKTYQPIMPGNLKNIQIPQKTIADRSPTTFSFFVWCLSASPMNYLHSNENVFRDREIKWVCVCIYMCVWPRVASVCEWPWHLLYQV